MITIYQFYNVTFTVFVSHGSRKRLIRPYPGITPRLILEVTDTDTDTLLKITQHYTE